MTNMTMSASVTKATKLRRLASGTEAPRMSTKSDDAGIPPNEVRARARCTWSLQATRTPSAGWLIS